MEQTHTMSSKFLEVVRKHMDISCRQFKKKSLYDIQEYIVDNATDFAFYSSLVEVSRTENNQ